MSTTAYVRAALGVLNSSARKRLILAVSLLAVIALLDLVAVVLVFALVASGTDGDRTSSLSLPGWLDRLLDLAGADTSDQQMTVAGAAVLVLFLGKSVAAAAILRRTLAFLARQEAMLTHGLMRDVMRAPLTFHLKRSYLDVMTDITIGAEALVMKAVAPFVLICSELLLVAILTGGLFLLAPLVAVSATAYFALVLILLNRLIGARTQEAAQDDVEATKSGMVVIQWALGAYREVATRGVQDYYVRKLQEIRSTGAQSRARVSYFAMIPRYFLESALVLGLGVTFAVQVPVVGVDGALAGLALFAVSGFRLVPSIQRLQSSKATIDSGLPFGERALKIKETLERTELVYADSESAEAVPHSITSHLELVDVTFRYPDSARPALQEVSVTFPAGRMTALVGPSGSGKSTLIDVLLGLLPPQSGHVAVDGRGLKAFEAQWLRSVGYVPQQVFLMATTIRENVALGVPPDEIGDEAVWDALERASLADVVKQLPGDIHFRLGDGGTGLSGGQRQRLGLARALYHNPQVLVLDEATSALDVVTEAEITETLAELRGLTKIVVAHRLSTVRNADLVIFLREGRVLAQGSFDQVSRQVPDFALQVKLSGMAHEGTN